MYSCEDKVALMFLLYSEVYNPSIWNQFFKDADSKKYNIYYHQKDEEKGEFNLKYIPSYRKKKIDYVPSVWGGIGIVQIQNDLLSEALKDKTNQRFIFVSQGCIPLYNFNEIYQRAMNTQKSIIKFDSLNETFPKYEFLKPIIKEKNIQKHQQWMLLTRKHAQMIIEHTDTINRILQNAPTLQEQWIPDEVVYGSLMKSKNQEDDILDRCVTYAKFSEEEITIFNSIERSQVDEAREIGCLFFRRTLPDNTFTFDGDSLEYILGKTKDRVKEKQDF
ncbi:UNKNOWN [Stylonychia lemnae]|uniref:Uncharacterized protein n=1 Tax=Stylonychia lemnae TaxID=5949 RepID=A0A077ZZT3_STYLE|nr:UNKNOWN [Stylonychia lemnae]|eukprot:CDW75441.1 UNKNOWN [Stylonychia lemnae]